MCLRKNGRGDVPVENKRRSGYLAPVVFTFEKLFGNETVCFASSDCFFKEPPQGAVEKLFGSETVMFHKQTVFQGQLYELSLKN